jgi:hypothetical protein
MCVPGATPQATVKEVWEAMEADPFYSPFLDRRPQTTDGRKLTRWQKQVRAGGLETWLQPCIRMPNAYVGAWPWLPVAVPAPGSLWPCPAPPPPGLPHVSVHVPRCAPTSQLCACGVQVSRILTSRVRFGFFNTNVKKDGLFVYKYDAGTDHTTRKAGGGSWGPCGGAGVRGRGEGPAPVAQFWNASHSPRLLRRLASSLTYREWHLAA